MDIEQAHSRLEVDRKIRKVDEKLENEIALMNERMCDLREFLLS